MQDSKQEVTKVVSFMKIYQACPDPLTLMDTLGNISAIFNKVDNSCDFLFVVMHTNLLLKRGLP